MKMCQKNAYFQTKKRLSSENFEDPQKILRMTILRKFWGWRASENSEDLQKILRMTSLRKFWGSSENSEDDDPQKILRILKKRWGFLREIWRLLRKFWVFLSKFGRVSRIVCLITIKKFLYIYIWNYANQGSVFVATHQLQSPRIFCSRYFQRKLGLFSADITSVSS